nr:receptor-type guanylate cyclase gcy-12-like [Cherax quadricarinatus]
MVSRLVGRLMVWAAVLHAHTTQHHAHARTFMLGYLTGSQRLPEDLEYKRPGLIISGSITLAVEEVNTAFPLVDGHQLNFTVAETYGQEEMSILQTAQLWISNISAYIGPQETCVHEARMAAAFNLPMISYFCTHPETSDKESFPTFARTRPPDNQISKSVTSILKRFNWRKRKLNKFRQIIHELQDTERTVDDSKLETDACCVLTWSVLLPFRLCLLAIQIAE